MSPLPIRESRRSPNGPTVAAVALALLFLASSLLVLSNGGAAHATAPSAPTLAPSVGASANVFSTPSASPATARADPSPSVRLASSRPDAASTVATIDLYKNSVISGMAIPRYVNGPTGIAYNSINHLEMITGGASAVLFDPTTGIVQSFPQPLINGTNAGPARQLGGVLFDPITNQTFIADETDSSLLVYSTSALGVVTYARTISLTTGIQPNAMALDPRNNRVFVGDMNNSTVSVIDAKTDSFITDVGVGALPASLTYDPVQDAIYVVNTGTHNITWIDPNTLSTGLPFGSTFALPNNPVAIVYGPVQDIIWTLEPGYLTAFNSTSRATSTNFTLASASPTALLWDAGQNELYAVNAPSGAISVFNMSGIVLTHGAPPNSGAKKPAFTISTGGTPGLAVFDSHLGEADLLDAAANSVIRIPDTSQTVVGRLPLGASPGGMAFNPVTDAMVVADTVSNRLYEVNSRNTTAGSVPISRSIPVQGHPMDVAYDPDTGWLVAISNPGTVTAINPISGTINTTVHLGSTFSLWNVLYAEHQIFVTGSSGYLFVFNASTLVKTQAVQIGSGGPSAPRMLAYDSLNKNVYVALEGDNRIAIISSSTDHQIGTLVSSGAPVAIAYDSAANHLFVASTQSSSLFVVDPTSGNVLRSFPLGYLPGWITFVPNTDTMYVSNLRSDTVTVVDATFANPAFDVPVGAYPGAMGFSPVTGDLFVADQASSTLSVVPAAPPPFRAPFTVFLSVTPSVTDVGVPVAVSVTSDLVQGLSYFYPLLPAGCATQDTARLSCHPSAVGTGEPVSVTVSNLAGDSVNLSTTIAVNPLPQVVSFTATPSAITLTGTVNLQVIVTGGVSPYKYAYAQVPFGCSAPAAASWNCTPLSQGNPSTVAVTVTDAVQYSVGGSVSFTVNLVPQLHLSLSANSTKIGELVTISVNVSQGTGPFSYAYSGLPTGCHTADVSPLTCIPSAAGVFPVRATVVDSSGYTVDSTIVLTVVGGASSSGSMSSFLYVALALIAVVAAVAVALLLWRRSRPREAAGGPEEPKEELYGAARPSSLPPRPSVEAVAVAGQRMPLAPTPEVSSTTPHYFAQPDEEGTVVEATAPAAAPPEGARPPVQCPHCGEMNQPWLINCRHCSWPLAQT